MNKKIIIAGILAILICSTGIGIYFHKNSADNLNNSNNVTKKQTDNRTSVSAEKSDITVKQDKQKTAFSLQKAGIEKQGNATKEAELYNNSPASVLPLSAISELADVPKNISSAVSKIAETNNIFMIQNSNNKLLIITDNPDNIRHSVEFTEISLNNGHQVKTTLGYNDKMSDSDNDIWEYNPQTQQPTRHTKYNKDGDVEFVEIWNYDDDNPIKYEMKDSDGKVISIRKETLQDGTNLRVEHLIYDNNGNTKVNVSATYDGEDVKRFTYYNADKPSESGSVFCEYSDGMRTKETVYTSDLKVKNIYTSEYKDGSRDEITKWDSHNNEVEHLIQPK